MLETRRQRSSVSSDDSDLWLIEGASWTDFEETTPDTEGSQGAGLDKVCRTYSKLDNLATAIADEEDGPRSRVDEASVDEDGESRLIRVS